MKKLLLILVCLNPLFVKSQMKSELSFYFEQEIFDLLIDVDKSEVKDIELSINHYWLPDEKILHNETISFKFLNDSIFEQFFDKNRDSSFWLIKDDTIKMYDKVADTIINYKDYSHLNLTNVDSSFYQYDNSGKIIYYWHKNSSSNQINEWQSKDGDRLDIHKAWFVTEKKLKYESYTQILKEVENESILKRVTSKNYLPDAKRKKIVQFQKKTYLFDINKRLTEIEFSESEKGNNHFDMKTILSIKYN